MDGAEIPATAPGEAGLPREAAGAGASVECRLDSAHDLATLLSALQLREKDQKDQRVHCEASSRGLKFTAQSNAKDVVVLGWMFSNVFQEYKFTGAAEELHLWLPVAPLLSCLHIFGDRAVMTLKYPSGPSDEVHLTLEEEGAVTECRLKTMLLGEAPPVGAFFAPGDLLTMFRPSHPEAWHQALSEFAEFDAPDVSLRVTLRAASSPGAPAVTLRAKTLSSDAEVDMPRSALDELELAPQALAAGEASHSYPLPGVLAGCLRAAREAKAVKVRFNAEGVMSTQFILRGRGPRDLFCETLLSPLAELAFAGVAASTAVKRKSYASGESLGF